MLVTVFGGGGGGGPPLGVVHFTSPSAFLLMPLAEIRVALTRQIDRLNNDNNGEGEQGRGRGGGGSTESEIHEGLVLSFSFLRRLSQHGHPPRGQTGHEAAAVYVPISEKIESVLRGSDLYDTHDVPALLPVMTKEFTAEVSSSSSPTIVISLFEKRQGRPTSATPSATSSPSSSSSSTPTRRRYCHWWAFLAFFFAVHAVSIAVHRQRPRAPHTPRAFDSFVGIVNSSSSETDSYRAIENAFFPSSTNHEEPPWIDPLFELMAQIVRVVGASVAGYFIAFIHCWDSTFAAFVKLIFGYYEYCLTPIMEISKLAVETISHAVDGYFTLFQHCWDVAVQPAILPWFGCLLAIAMFFTWLIVRAVAPVAIVWIKNRRRKTEQEVNQEETEQQPTVVR